MRKRKSEKKSCVKKKKSSALAPVLRYEDDHKVGTTMKVCCGPWVRDVVQDGARHERNERFVLKDPNHMYSCVAAAEKIGLPRGKEATRERKHGAQKQAVVTRQWRWSKEKSTIK